MTKTTIQININPDLEHEVTMIFSALGLDMSTAVNMFLHQCVLRGELPFSTEIPQSGRKLLGTKEAELIPNNSDISKLP